MANDNMKKWLAVLDETSVSPYAPTKRKMLTEELDSSMREIHSDVLMRPEKSATADSLINKVAGGMRGVNRNEVRSHFDKLSKSNGFDNFADELAFAQGEHEKDTHIGEDLVDEDDVEEGNKFSGELKKAREHGEDSFEVDGEEYDVKEGTELVSEEWNVVYDSTYARNIPVQVKLKSGMDESAVREWFNKAFQPLNIHEVFKKNKNIEENPMAPQQQQQQPPQQSGGIMKQAAAAVGQVVGAYKDAKQQQLMKQMGIQPGQATGQIKPGVVKVDTKNKVIQTQAGSIPFTQMITASVDREKRSNVEADDYAKMLEDIHTRLDGNYDLDTQKIAIQAVADMHKISYEKLLAHWFEDPEGLKMQMKADDEISAEQPPAEVPPTPGPEASAAPPAPAPAPPAPGNVPTISEGHQITLDVEDDHEVRMAQAGLYQIAKNAAALHAMLDHVDELEGWVQSKITLATDYIERVRDYLEYETIRNSEIPDEDHHHDEIFEDREVKKKKK